MSHLRMGRQNTIKALLKRDGNRCSNCGRELKPWDYDSISIDYIVPVSMGGDDKLDNLQLCCMMCNTKIGNHKIVQMQFAFETLMLELLARSTRYKAVVKNYRVSENLIADLKFETKEKIYLGEIKVSALYTWDRIMAIVAHFQKCREVFAYDFQAVLIIFSKLSESYRAKLTEHQVEIWDREYITRHFSGELREMNSPLARVLKGEPEADIRTEINSWDQLVKRLRCCEPGKDNWKLYQDLVGEILTKLFAEDLEPPIREVSIRPIT